MKLMCVAGVLCISSSVNAMLVAADARAIVAEMLAESFDRASLVGKIEPAITAVQVGGLMQFRHYVNVRESSTAGNVGEHGFAFSRVRMKFSGRLDDSVDYLVLGTAGETGAWSSLVIWARYRDAESGWWARAGQFKLPLWKEWGYSARYTQLVERSVLTNVFASIYTQGFQIGWGGTDLRWSFAVSDGLRALRSSFVDNIEADWAITGRVEALLSGTFAAAKDLTSLGSSQSTLAVGFAGHFQGETESFRGIDVDSVFQYTADASYETQGWNVFGAFVGRHIERGDGRSEDDFGFLLQSGVFVTDTIELVGRYEAYLPDSASLEDDVFHGVTGGVNWYLHGHALKFTADCVIFSGSLAGSSGTGFGPSERVGFLETNEDGQLVLRVQLQVVF